jgi:hypothetical protein
VKSPWKRSNFECGGKKKRNALEHEAGNHTMENASFVCFWWLMDWKNLKRNSGEVCRVDQHLFRLYRRGNKYQKTKSTGAEGTEIFGCFGESIGVEAHDNARSVFAVDGDIKVDFVGDFWLLWKERREVVTGSFFFFKNETAAKARAKRAKKASGRHVMSLLEMVLKTTKKRFWIFEKIPTRAQLGRLKLFPACDHKLDLDSGSARYCEKLHEQPPVESRRTNNCFEGCLLGRKFRKRARTSTPLASPWNTNRTEAEFSLTNDQLMHTNTKWCICGILLHQST